MMCVRFVRVTLLAELLEDGTYKKHPPKIEAVALDPDSALAVERAQTPYNPDPPDGFMKEADGLLDSALSEAKKQAGIS